jgi:cyclopropane fatty-acyl-phospholipid synthase-like methyltransferase
MLGGRLTLAPIDNPARVLDVGTGTGIWAIAMADNLPEASDVVGTDLSPIQPEWYLPRLNCAQFLTFCRVPRVRYAPSRTGNC